MKKVITKTNFTKVKQTYWPFLLSPVIFAIRSYQRIKLAIQKNPTIESDVEMPSPTINNLLYKVTNFEQKYLGWKPWGSSLFIVLEK